MTTETQTRYVFTFAGFGGLEIPAQYHICDPAFPRIAQTLCSGSIVIFHAAVPTLPADAVLCPECQAIAG